MVEVALLLSLFVGVGIFAHSYNNWTRLVMILIIVGVLVLFYLT
jgi:multidrug transporter EmrE-like cation transporter